MGGRFKNLSEDFYRFVCSFETLHDAADAVWFVSARDYASSGAEPIYEDTLVIAQSFEEFIALFLAALTDKNAAKYPFSCFV
ncbi:hypothetical protein [uncultured Campylobacter sp.]|uniref:hypothetical protein n=1 Tax=uncultured Campylobacter sp. TaxID=218934 RepID=UPI0026246A7E|nr:hypothetical protein [uncultured Campylobacter sp.]